MISLVIRIIALWDLYYTKGEYNYMTFPIAFILNAPIYFVEKTLS